MQYALCKRYWEDMSGKLRQDFTLADECGTKNETILSDPKNLYDSLTRATAEGSKGGKVSDFK